MTHGSLFSGIGGFDLAAEWMGWENKFHCEWNEFGQKVLNHYWPQAELFTDITKSDFTKYANTIDILTGGFPCQPYSSAGKRLGKEDDRHLWPQMLRAIREIQPRWIVGENVRGLTNWNGGLVFDEVQADLEAEGYEVLPFLLPACAVNAPHRRDRIWFVAYSNGTEQKHNRGTDNPEKGEIWRDEKSNVSGELSCNGDASNTMSIRLQQCKNRTEMAGGSTEMEKQRSESSDAFETNGEIQYVTDTNGIGLWRQGNWTGKSGFIDKNSKANNWENFPTVSPICNGDDGISNRLDNITFPKWRNESIKAGGNAIVPQVALQIFKAIEQYERIRTTNED